MQDVDSGSAESTPLRDDQEADLITADERAEWLINYILLHQTEDRTKLIRRAIDQFLAAEAVAYMRGRRAAENPALARLSGTIIPKQ